MRASRVLSLFLVFATATTLTACGADDDGERLTRAEYDLLVRQHRQAVAATKSAPETEEGVRKLVSLLERQCAELAGSGAVLRATAPSCSAGTDALSSFTAFAARVVACSEDDDGSCYSKALDGFVGSLDDMVEALDESDRALGPADLSDACRAALAGPKALRSTLTGLRDTGREFLEAEKALGDADERDSEKASERLEQAATRFDAAGEAFAKQGDGDAETNPKPCEADVEEG